jgi:hypothetical protein
MQAILSDLLDSIVEFPSAIGEVAAQSPITAVLVAIGALLIGVSMAVFGYLSLGAAVDFVTPH